MARGRRVKKRGTGSTHAVRVALGGTPPLTGSERPPATLAGHHPDSPSEWQMDVDPIFTGVHKGASLGPTQPDRKETDWVRFLPSYVLSHCLLILIKGLCILRRWRGSNQLSILRQGILQTVCAN